MGRKYNVTEMRHNVTQISCMHHIVTLMYGNRPMTQMHYNGTQIHQFVTQMHQNLTEMRQSVTQTHHNVTQMHHNFIECIKIRYKTMSTRPLET